MPRFPASARLGATSARFLWRADCFAKRREDGEAKHIAASPSRCVTTGAIVAELLARSLRPCCSSSL